ncbi:unnamed protein product [Musa textilis]
MADEFRGCKGRPQLLDQWSVQESSRGKSNYETTEEKNLELKFGLPGGEDWSAAQEKRELRAESALSLRHVPRVPETTNANGSSGSKKGFSGADESKTDGTQPDKTSYTRSIVNSYIVKRIYVRHRLLLL